MGKHVIERFEDLVTRILSKSKFPVINWADKTSLAERSSSNNELTQEKAQEIIAYVDTHLREAGLTAPFPFKQRTSTRSKSTTRIEYNKKVVEPLLTSFFEKYDEPGKKKLAAKVYQDPCAPDKAVIHTQYIVEKKIAQVDARKHVIFVLDRSASMEAQDKLANLKKLVKHAIAQLGNEDTFSIVYFNEMAEVLCRAQNKSEFKDQELNRIIAQGSTDLLSPFELIQSQSLIDEQTRNMVCFVTDGQHTVDEVVNRDAIPTAIKEKLSDNMSLITIGIGGDYDAEMIQKLSTMIGNPVPVHIQDEQGFEAAYRTMHVLSLPLTAPVKLQLMTADRKISLHRTFKFPFNVEQELFLTTEKSDLENAAELILIDQHKSLARQTFSEGISLQIMPSVVMIAWIRSRIHEILTGDLSDRESLNLQFNNLELVIVAHLKIDATDQLASNVEQLKALLAEAKSGLDNQDDRRNSTFYSNGTQGACDRHFSQMGAQPLTLGLHIAQEQASAQRSQQRDVSARSERKSVVRKTQKSASV